MKSSSCANDSWNYDFLDITDSNHLPQPSVFVVFW